jgi:hypothetical protein
MYRIQSTGPRQVAAVLATVRGGERACIVAPDVSAADVLAARLRGEGFTVSQAGHILEIDPTDMLH